jgi:DNA-binding CsgD family transcriptional regulator
VSALDQVYLADGDLQRNGPVVAARAEILWLEGRAADIGRATEVTLELALRCRAPWVVGELAYWRRQAGLRDELPDELVAEPYRLALAEDARGAARCWDGIGGPYEAALALADSTDLDDVVRSLEALQAMGARTAAAIVERGLRDQGVRGVRRGPRPATRANPAGLTARELEVLALVAEGLRNAEIAERLVVSEKTVGHHVSAVLRKLEVRSRVDAGREAARLGIELPAPR